MKILRLTCRGFKTYRDTVTVGPFDGKLNCVVGFNGSGKSSLFQAIAFVLSPCMGGVSSSSIYLHEGSSGKALSGFVELELDNTDKLFPVDADAVTLRRALTGTNRADEFTVNGKHVSRQEYVLLLQAVNLMGKGKRSNGLPFFYVEQGRITATVSDSDRLELLKEACGIDVFSEKRVESIELQTETEKNRAKIEELMKEIDQRCDELRRESAQLDEYAAVKRRRDIAEFESVSLELGQYSILQKSLAQRLREQRNLRAQLEEKLDQINDHEELDSAIEIPEQEDHVCTITREIEVKKNQLDELHDERRKLISSADQVDQLIAEMNTRKTAIMSELEKDKENETVAKVRLHKAQADFERFVQEQDVSSESLCDRRDQLVLLLASAERGCAQLQREIHAMEKELRELKSRSIPDHMQRVRVAQEAVALYDTQLEQHETLKSELTAEIKRITNESFSKKQNVFSIQQELEKLEKEFKETSGSVLRSSNANTRDLVSRSDIKGVEGFLGDFIRIPSAYRTAVESSLRSVLFNVVISDDSVADQIATKLAGGKGRVTLTAVNRLGDESNAASEMDARISSSGLNAKLVSSVVSSKAGSSIPWVPRAIAKFFSRTAIVDSIDTGVEIAKRFKIDAVTIDGDVVSKDLVVKGGDPRSNRKRVFVVKNWQQSLEMKIKIEVKSAEMKSALDVVKTLDSELWNLQARMDELMNETMDRSGYEDSKLVLVNERAQLAVLRDREIEIEKFQLPNMRDVDLPARIQDSEKYRRELKDVEQRIASGSQGQVLSGPEQVRRSAIAAENVKRAKEELGRSETELALVSKRAAGHKSELVHFVESRLTHLAELRDEQLCALRHLEDRVGKVSQDVNRLENLELPKAEIIRSAKMVEHESRVAIPDELDGLDKNELESEIQSLDSELKSLEFQLSSVETDIVKVKELLRTLPQTIDNMMDIDTDSTIRLRRLRAAIVEANAELNSQKFQYINKKSVEQYERINSERLQLKARQNELNANQAAISNLLENMTAKETVIVKDAFGRVKGHFERLFGRLVEGGSAELNLELNEDIHLSGNLNVSVAFPGGESKSRMKRLQELSGGQRTMVGLCFLIALQKAQERTHSCLILDEVDAALDSTYRSTIAETLYEESHRNVQILCTSFRPEFCAVATKHWLVSMVNGSTRVDAVDASTAMSLVADNGDEPANDVSARE